MKNHYEGRLGKYHSRKNCRFCNGTNLTKILDFGNVPLAGGFLKEKDFEDEKYYPLDLSFCEDCCLVQVTNVVPADVLFKNYFYFSSSIGTLVDHCAEFAKETMERFLGDSKTPSVFEIGYDAIPAFTLEMFLVTIAPSKVSMVVLTRIFPELAV